MGGTESCEFSGSKIPAQEAVTKLCRPRGTRRNSPTCPSTPVAAATSVPGCHARAKGALFSDGLFHRNSELSFVTASQASLERGTPRRRGILNGVRTSLRAPVFPYRATAVPRKCLEMKARFSGRMFAQAELEGYHEWKIFIARSSLLRTRNGCARSIGSLGAIIGSLVA